MRSDEIIFTTFLFISVFAVVIMGLNEAGIESSEGFKSAQEAYDAGYEKAVDGLASLQKDVDLATQVMIILAANIPAAILGFIFGLFRPSIVAGVVVGALTYRFLPPYLIKVL